MEVASCCLECRKITEIIIDHRSGDVICAECGLILENHYIDDNAEWRTFVDDNNGKDPNRVGARQNPFLDGGNLSTIIVKPKAKAGSASDDVFHSSLGRLSTRKSDPNKTLIGNFETIALFADRLGLVETIKNRAYQIYKNVEDKKSCRGRKIEAVLAACLHIACREEKLSRTFKEIREVANGVSAKEILKAQKLIERQVEINVNKSGQHAGELVRRFCSNLGMSNKAIKAVHEAYQKSEEIDIRRNPQSILAAIIYVISQLSDDKKPLRDVSRTAGVAEGTIKKCYRDIYPDFPKLIPTWFAKEEDIRKISSP